MEFTPLLQIIVAVVAIMAWVGVNAIFLVWVERKVAGHVQRRPGPYEVGPHGLLQPLIDGIKLMCKQLIIPDNVDKKLYLLAPVLSFLPVVLVFMPLPHSNFLTGMEMNLGILLILAFSGINVLGVLLAGWASNNKWGLLGGARAVAQSVAYEIPLLLSVLAIAFMTGTLNLSTITEMQGSWPWQWNIVVQPLAFIIFFVAAIGETNRAPFDLPEGESELTGGYHTDYSAMGFGLYFMAEYAYMVVICSVCTVLFLGGFKGPFVDGWWWFLAKVYLLLFVIVWIRWTYPRVTFAQLLNINWKWLLPLATINLLATTFFMKVF